MGFLSSIWGIIAIPLGYVMRWCYQLFEDVLHFPLAYVFALFLFTVVTKAILFPLAIKQQRSSATMAAFKPMMDEINRKYAKDPQKKNEELQKLQTEYGYSPMAGCLPTLIQFPIIFGLIEVIYKPLTYMIRIPTAVISVLTAKTTELMAAADVSVVERYIETNIIEYVKGNFSAFSGLSAEGVAATDFSAYLSQIRDLEMSIGSINLWEKPSLAFNAMLLIPIFSVVTMLLSTYINMKVSGSLETGGSQGKTMMISMSLMFAFFSFMYPAGFSLYWGFQNLVIIVQSFIVRKIVNVDTVRAQIEAQIEEKKRLKKEKKKVKLLDESTGGVIEKEISPAELARIRLQKAREIDERRYNASKTSEQDEAESDEADSDTNKRDKK